jgi:hypothetical protein
MERRERRHRGLDDDSKRQPVGRPGGELVERPDQEFLHGSASQLAVTPSRATVFKTIAIRTARPLRRSR